MSTPRLDQKGFINHDGTTEKIVGSFEVDAAPAVNIINILGKGFTVAVTAAGRYTITLTNAAYRLVSGTVMVDTVGAAAIDLYSQLGTFTPGAAPTAIVRTLNTGVETDILVNDRLYFELTVYGNPVDA